jgi:mono/diheme cytochrome c family protein
MEFPIFHLDLIGNRLLIAVIAIIHAIISHSMAVGGIPLIAWLEWKGFKRADLGWGDVTKKILFFFFVITTSVGAMTGVGIWLSASLINPVAIGSLLRVFFWTWFVEWIVFVTEVVLILFYYLTWDRWVSALKRKHVKLGAVLAVSSWITMALIVAILSFMMDTGNWLNDRSLFSAMANPIYIPQLMFRTPLAMIMGGAAAFFVLAWVKNNDSVIAVKRAVARWMLAWVPILAFGAFKYARVIPDFMAKNAPVALGTQEFADWYLLIERVTVGSVAIVIIFALVIALRPTFMPRFSLMVPFVILIGVMGQFERVREFIRKPYAIAGYLYANGLREEDYGKFQEDGILKHYRYAKIQDINQENRVEAGREVFLLACSRCHTVHGVNSVITKFKGISGGLPLDEGIMSAWMVGMHHVKPFMPPFPGNDVERDALGAFIVASEKRGEAVEGMQSTGLW